MTEVILAALIAMLMASQTLFQGFWAYDRRTGHYVHFSRLH